MVLGQTFSFFDKMVFYTAPHDTSTKEVGIYDVTSFVTPGEPILFTNIEQMIAATSLSPCLILDCGNAAAGHKAILYASPQPGQRYRLAEWKAGPWYSFSRHLIFFANDGSDGVSGGPVNRSEFGIGDSLGRRWITLRRWHPFHWISHIFRYESYPCGWERNIAWDDSEFILTKNIYMNSTINALATQTRKLRPTSERTEGWQIEGLLFVDNSQLDWRVALATYLVELRNTHRFNALFLQS